MLGGCGRLPAPPKQPINRRHLAELRERRDRDALGLPMQREDLVAVYGVFVQRTDACPAPAPRLTSAYVNPERPSLSTR